jgi:hypothetical protein
MGGTGTSSTTGASTTGATASGGANATGAAASTAAHAGHYGQGWNQQRCDEARRAGRQTPKGACPAS